MSKWIPITDPSIEKYKESGEFVILRLEYPDSGLTCACPGLWRDSDFFGNASEWFMPGMPTTYHNHNDFITHFQPFPSTDLDKTTASEEQ